MSFVQTGDWHMDPQGFRRELPGEDCVIIAEALINQVLEIGCPMVATGDIFNKNRPVSWVVGETKRILDRLPEFWYIQGNHDKDRERAWLTIVDRARPLYPEAAVDVGGQMLCGIDYAPMEEFGEALGKVPEGVDGLVIHQALKQGLRFEGAWNADLDIFDPGKIRDIWAGDLHAPMECWSKDKQVRAVYSGSLWPRNIDEAKHQQRAVLVLDELDDDGHRQYRSLYLPKRPVINIAIESEEDLAAKLDDESFVQTLVPDTYQDIDPRLRAPVLHVRYYADIVGVEESFKALQQALGGGFYIETVMPSRDSFISKTLVAAELGDEAVTFQRLVADAAASNDEVRSFALELAECTSMEQVRSVIETWREKKMGPPDVAA